MIYYAGLKNIPETLIEAARIDGANALQIAWKIKLPLVMEVFKVTIVLAVIGSLKYFDLIYIMTGGGPNGASEVMASYMYRIAFNIYDFGRSGGRENSRDVESRGHGRTRLRASPPHRETGARRTVVRPGGGAGRPGVESARGRDRAPPRLEPRRAAPRERRNHRGPLRAGADRASSTRSRIPGSAPRSSARSTTGSTRSGCARCSRLGRRSAHETPPTQDRWIRRPAR